MDFATYIFDSPAQFYAGRSTAKLKDVLEGGGFHASPESRVGAFISLLVLYQNEFLDASDQDLARCCYRLIDSDVYQKHMEMATRSIIDRAIQSPEDKDMWITYNILLYAGKEYPKVYHWMLKSEFVAKLKYQILRWEALADEAFLNYLLDLVEHTRTDEAELLNYSAIKLLLAFNEQYMLNMSNQAHYTQAGAKLACLQMLILKLLYLLFTSPSLFEFFYTNDLHVLVDVVIRELWDLPEEEESLRHAYLRVMGPLLTNTQLKHATYKRAEIVRVLRELGGGALDSTLRRQLQEQQRKEQLLEQERALCAKVTYRDRLSSSSSSSALARWASDRSGCSSPVLSFEVEKKKSYMGQSRLSNSSSSSLKVPGQDEAKEAAHYYALHQQLSSSPQEEGSEFIRVEQPKPDPG
ncbi:hypothetical protein BGZ58_000601, partial [Dissophora ornata]